MLDLQGRVDRLFKRFQARGFMKFSVRLATVTYTAANPAAGDPGTPSTAFVDLGTSCLVQLRDQFRSRAGLTVHVGDGLVVMPRDYATQAQLIGASYVEIAAVKYTIVAGELKQDPFTWSFVVKRQQA